MEKRRCLSGYSILKQLLWEPLYVHILANRFMSEKRSRSVAKSISWRVICVIVSIVVSYILTAKWDVSVAIGGIYNLITMFLYYFHERIWHRIDWGLKNKSELTEKEKQKVMERLKKLGYLDWQETAKSTLVDLTSVGSPYLTNSSPHQTPFYSKQNGQ